MGVSKLRASDQHTGGPCGTLAHVEAGRATTARPRNADRRLAILREDNIGVRHRIYTAGSSVRREEVNKKVERRSSPNESTVGRGRVYKLQGRAFFPRSHWMDVNGALARKAWGDVGLPPPSAGVESICFTTMAETQSKHQRLYLHCSMRTQV